MNENVFTISEITQNIKETIEGKYSFVTVEGEISNYRPNASGHLYFVLKDDGAQISAVMFKSRASTINFQVKDGMKVQATGSLSVYAPQGKYQIVISKMEIAGEGDILKLIEDRKRRLAEEGIFNTENKRKLPRYPKKVGIITSPTGAAVRDILNIAKRRNSGISVVVLPALVQGDTAAPTIVKQIETANAYKMCDVLIVGRGGGSLEDLLPFSDENVVRAIAKSTIPIVSAVGHEIDWALSDYAADIRAPTPSAAAELVFPLKEEIFTELEAYGAFFQDRMNQLVHDAKMELKTFDSSSMEIRLMTILHPLKSKLEESKRIIVEEMKERIKHAKDSISNSTRTLEVANPENVLKRGFAVVIKSDGKIARSPSEIDDGEIIGIKLAEGEIGAKVIAKNESKTEEI